MHKAFNWLICLSGVVLLCACSTTKDKSVNLEKAAMLNTELGNGYLAQGKLDIAKIKFEKALDENPSLAAAHAGYGLLWSQLGDAKKADKHFRRALKTDPYNSTFLNNYGTFLCGQNRFKDADKNFMAALKDPLYKTPEYAFTNAGRCSLKAREFDKAEAYFGKALEVNPRFPDALLAMATLYEQQKNYRLANSYMEKYEKYGTHTPESLWTALHLARRLGAKNRAASYELLLKNKFPDSPQAQKLRGGNP